MGFKMDQAALRRKFKKFESDMAEAMDRTAKEHIEAVFAETQILVPKKTGQLAATGETTKNESATNKFSYSIHYGDNTVDYAAAVHEILKASHAPPTQAKFVEQPLVASQGAFKVKMTLAANNVKGTSFK